MLHSVLPRATDATIDEFIAAVLPTDRLAGGLPVGVKWPLPSFMGDRAYRPARGEPAVITPDGVGEKLCRCLKGAGFELIGYGDDAIVFALPGEDWVYRLAPDLFAFSAFARIARDSGNPHFPLISEYRSTETDCHNGESGQGVCLVRMERLEPINITDRELWVQANQAASIAHACADYRPFFGETVGPLSGPIDTAARSLGDWARENHHALDLSGENIMMRPATREVVFTDPWSAWGV